MTVNKRFIEFLLIELNSIKDDLDDMVKIFQERFKNHELTKYVNLENTALIDREKDGIKMIKSIVEKFDISKYDDIDMLAQALLDDIKTSVIDEYDYPKALCCYIEKKIQKVKAYVLQK